MRRRTVLVLIASASLWMWSFGAAAEPQCDPNLAQDRSRSAGYQDRADRCEGIYKRDVSSFGIQLVALLGTSSLDDLCTGGQSVFLRWPLPRLPVAGTSIEVQIESLRPRLFYRVDARRPIGAKSFAWPPDPRCHNEARLRAAEVAALVKTAVTRAGKSLDVLLPASLTTDSAASTRPPVRAVLMPGRRVQEVYVTLWNLAGESPKVKLNERPLHARPYSPGIPIVVTLSPADLQDSGLYRLRLSVEFESGDRETLDHHFVNEFE